MADYKEIISGTLGSLVGKAKEIAGSESVKGVVEKIKGTAESTGVKDIYVQGADRAKAYGRITKLTLELNGSNTELGRVYAEIGRLYFEQHRNAPEGYFAPLFAQATELTEAIHAKEDEIAALKDGIGAGQDEPDIEVEIADFEQIVNATEADGTDTTPRD